MQSLPVSRWWDKLLMVVTSKPCSTTCPRLVGQDGARQNTQTTTGKRIVQQIESLICTICMSDSTFVPIERQAKIITALESSDTMETAQRCG